MGNETPQPKPLVIVGLKTENVKRIKAVHIVPNDPNTVVLVGANEAGKSSILDAIQWCLEGRENMQERPLRDGTSQGVTEIDLGDFLVKRTYKANGNGELTIHDKTAVKYKAPQAVLDSFLEHISFDPLAFTHMKKEEKRDMLRRLVGIDFSQLDAEKMEKFNERTDVNRRLQEQRARLGGYPKDPTAPESETSTAELLAKLDEIQRHNSGVSDLETNTGSRKRVLDAAKSGVAEVEAAIKELEKQMEQLKADRVEAIGVVTKAQEEFDTALSTSSNAKRIDEAPIRQQLSTLDESNGKVRTNREHDKIAIIVDGLRASSEKLTARLEEIDATKTKMMKEANFPLKGLSFDESGVTLNGIPFEQASQARQLQASVSIALALRGRLKVILIRDASLLDRDSMKMMMSMAREHGAQIWYEKVLDRDLDKHPPEPYEVVIEDGMVKE